MRQPGSLGWNVWRALIGVGYLAAAGFNLFFTLPEGDLGWFADNAWSPLLADSSATISDHVWLYQTISFLRRPFAGWDLASMVRQRVRRASGLHPAPMSIMPCGRIRPDMPSTVPGE